MPGGLLRVDASGTMIDDDGIRTILIPGGVNLASLSLAHCYQLTERGIASLTAFPHLRVLDITAAAFGEHHGRIAVPLLSRCLPLLEELRMMECSGIEEPVLSDAMPYWLPRHSSSQHIRQLAGLSLLDLTYCSGVSEQMFALLEGDHTVVPSAGRCSGPTISLVLARGGAHVNPVMLKQLGAALLPRLSSLSLADCSHVTDAAISCLFQKSSGPLPLTSLDLSQCFVSDRALVKIATSSAAQSLTFLSLRGNYKVTDEGLKTIGQHFTRLESLHLGGTTIGDSGLAFLVPLAQTLKHLSLAGCAIYLTEMGLLALEPFLLLETLDLFDCASLSRSGCGEALSVIPSLTSLSLAGCTQLDTECIAQLSKSVGARANLRSLNVRHCPMITNSAVDALMQFRALEEIDMTATQISMPEMRRLAAGLPELQRVTPKLGPAP
jgi:hypothetical protein